MADEKTESTETPDAPETKPKKKRILLKLFVVLILLLVLVVVFAPTIASSSAGKGYIESFANDAIPGSIQIDGLQLGWMSGQEITGLKVLDPDGQVVIAADSVSIGDLTLLAAAQGDLNIGKVKLTKPVINIEQYDDGSTNLDKAFGLSQEKSNEPVSLPKGLAVDAELVDGQVTFKASGIDPVEMADIDATASLKPAGTAIELKLTTPVQQGSAKGEVDVSATVNDLFDSNGQMQMAAMAVDGYVDLKKLPVDLADRLAGQDGRLTALLSEILNGRIEVKGNPESQLNSTLTFNSDRLKKGSLVLEITPKQITIKPDLQLEIIPQGWAKLTKDAAKLNQPFSVSVLPDEAIVIARNGNEIDIAKSVAKVQLAVGDIHLDAGGDVGKVDLVNTNGSVNFAGPDNIIKLSINANGKRGERTGAITITGDVQNPFDSDGKFNLAQTTATVIGEVDQVVLQVLDDILATEGEIASATGSDLQTVLKVQPSATESNEAFAGSAVFTAKAKNLTVDLSADIDADKIALKPNGKVTWKIEPQLLELVKKRMPDLSDDVKKLALQQAATLTVTTKATTIPAKDFSVEKVRFGVGVAIDRLAIKGDDRLAGIAVHTLNVDVPETTLADPVKFSGSTQLAIAKDQAGLEFGGTVTDALKKTLGYDVKTTLTNLPIDLAERFAASDGLLKKVLGKTLDEVKVAAKSGDAIALTATVKSKYLNANLPLDMAGNVFTFRDKPTIDLLLTPESFAALTASKDANAKAEYVIFDDQQLVLPGDGRNLVPPRLGHGDRGRRLQCRQAVQHPGRAVPAGGIQRRW